MACKSLEPALLALKRPSRIMTPWAPLKSDAFVNLPVPERSVVAGVSRSLAHGCFQGWKFLLLEKGRVVKTRVKPMWNSTRGKWQNMHYHALTCIPQKPETQSNNPLTVSRSSSRCCRRFGSENHILGSQLCLVVGFFWYSRWCHHLSPPKSDDRTSVGWCSSDPLNR